MTRVEYRDVAPGAKEDMAVTATEQQPFADISRLAGNTASPPRAVTLETGMWLLDGGCLPRGEGDWAFWSGQLCDDAPPELTLSFGGAYRSTGLTLYFYGDAWPDDITVKWYLGEQLVDMADFAPDALSYACIHEVAAFDRIAVIFWGMCLPVRYLRLAGLEIGLVRSYGDAELERVQIYEEVALYGQELSSNRLTLRLRSATPAGDAPYFFQRRQPLTVTVDGAPFGRFYLDKGSRIGQSRYEIEAMDAVGVLAESDFAGDVYEGIPFSQLLSQVLDTTPFTAETPADAPALSGLLPYGSRREALAQMALAAGLCVTTARGSQIRFFRPSGEAAHIGEGRVFKSELTAVAPATAVEVTAHRYVRSEEPVTAFTGALSGEGNLVMFREPLYSLAVTGGVITAFSANHALVNGSGATVTITGKRWRDEQLAVTLADGVALEGDALKTVRVPSGTLITPTAAPDVAERTLEGCATRQSVRADILLGEERCGDLVTIATPWSGVVTGRVESLDIELGGPTPTAKAVVRAI